MKLILTIVILTWLATGLFAEVTTKVDNPSGLDYTVTRVFEPGDKDYDKLVKVQIVYALNGVMKSVTQVFNQKTQVETGLASQEQIYVNGVATQFVMVNSAANAQITGVDKTIEWVDANDQTEKLEYFAGDKKIYIETKLETMQRFPFFRLDFLAKEMLPIGEDIVDKQARSVIRLSAKYVSAHSLVRFVGGPVAMDEADLELLKNFALNKGAPAFIPIYKSKVKVQVGDQSYYVFMQNDLLQFVKDGNMAVIRHYIVASRTQLNPVCVGFFDVK